ncbi:unnamed protein product, partial [Discosporangium mesarthrocarpum]
QPATVRATRISSKCSLWERAVEEEISGLVRNGVWVRSDLPPGQNPIGTKWVIKRKVNQFGEVVRYEGRLVALGFQQREG